MSAAHERREAGADLHVEPRFADHVIGATIEQPDRVEAIATSGQHDDRQLRVDGRAFGPNIVEKLDRVDPQIDDQRVDSV